jgi:hypothetical protein
VIHSDRDELPWIDAARVGGRVDLVEADAAGVDDDVRTLDRLEDGGGRGRPEYIPANWGWGSDRTPLSIAIAANGQPRASIKARSLSWTLNRETVKAGRTASDRAASMRSAIAATASARSGPLAGVGYGAGAGPMSGVTA